MSERNTHQNESFVSNWHPFLPRMADITMTKLSFACACGQVKGSVSVPTGQLPLRFDFCHCNMCRHQTGELAASFWTPPEDATDLVIEGSLTRYASSNTVTRAFCGNCGAFVSFEDKSQSKPDLSTGLLKGEGLLELQKHIFVADTIDGGLASWITDIPAYEGFSSGKRLDVTTFHTLTDVHNKATELRAHCLCKGVQFKITRPNPASTDLSSPVSDLFSAHIDGGKGVGDDRKKWWLRANGTKYLAGTCACNSCRLASGFDIQAWAFIPKANIWQANGEPLDFKIGTLKQYQSSEGTYRDFCGRCGATVFWHNETRPQLIDVSVGLLNAEEGARAESWLEWKMDRISFEEEAQNKALIHTLSKGMHDWTNKESS